MGAKKKTTAPFSSVDADEGQPLAINTNDSITENQQNINAEDEVFRMDFLFRQYNDPNYLNTVSLTELFDTSYKPKTQVIANFLLSGVYLFVGSPKVGKSFFMAQLGYHVSMGIPLWEYPVHKSTVLYLALEDDYGRLQKRISKMFGIDETSEFYFATHSKNLNGGLEGQLQKFITEHPNTSLVIIDTLQKIRQFGGEKYSYSNDYEIITKLKKFNEQYDICILLVHHTRKQNADDSFDTISGTNGLLGAADGAFIMQKEKRTDNNAVLDIVGRDQQDQRLQLVFDRERCIWRLEKIETELWKEPIDPIFESVSRLVTIKSPQWSGSASELIECLKLEIQANALTRRLNIGVDRLFNEYGIRYESNRSHAGRTVKLTFIGSEA